MAEPAAPDPERVAVLRSALEKAYRDELIGLPDDEHHRWCDGSGGDDHRFDSEWWLDDLAAVVAAQAGPPPLDVPPEAIEWARELVRQGYRDEHIVTFTENGYGLEHPIRCRPNLIGCMLNEWLATQMAPDREPGRYVMEWAENGPRYTRLSRTGEPSDQR